MSRKGVGLAAFDRSRLTSAHYASHGSSLRASNAQALHTQLDVFRSLVQQFANTHARDIRSDPSFRAQFARMCAAIGVDPLASSASSSADGSVWAQLLGKTVNDFYFELAVRVVEVCGATRGENGGFIGLSDLRERVSRGRMEGSPAVTDDDVRRAVDALKPLGGSYAVVRVGRKGEEWVRSVPRELGGDQAAVLEAVQVLGYVSVGMLRDNLGWEGARARTVVEDLVGEGVLWVDKQAKGEWEYWSLSFMATMTEETG